MDNSHRYDALSGIPADNRKADIHGINPRHGYRSEFTIFPNSAFAPRFNPTWITRAYSKNCGSFSQYVEIVVLAKVPQKIPAVKHKITIRLFFIETSFLDK